MVADPNVVRFEESFVHNDDLCILMQYCPDGDLMELLAKQRSSGRRLPEADVRCMLAQLAAALAHIHSRRVVHRDIKSSNVFIDSGRGRGGTRQLLLGDFGVAKARHVTSTRPRAASVKAHHVTPPREHRSTLACILTQALESTKAMACTQCGTVRGLILTCAPSATLATPFC